jgi:hypothetical protein
MRSPKQREASRLNGRQSRGPKSIDGKNRSRFNALKHGLTAQTPVLPGEDPATYHERLDAWTADLQPRNHVEHSLVGRAVQATWQLERAERAEVARVAQNMRHATDQEELQQAEEVLALGRRLFHDPCGTIAAYPHPSRHSWNESSRLRPEDEAAGGPAAIVLMMEATAAGCRWLLNRWTELRDVLEKGQSWGSPDKLKAVRLLGRHPLDAAPDPEVATIYLACHVIEPIFPDPFQEQMYELTDTAKQSYRLWLKSRQVETLRPPDGAAARAVLLDLVRREISRPETVFDVRQSWADIDRGEQAQRMAFDTSPDGERLRRHVLSTSRVLLRTLDAFVKIRKSVEIDPAAYDIGASDLAPETPAECVAGPESPISHQPDAPARERDPAYQPEAPARILAAAVQNEPEPALALPEPMAAPVAASPPSAALSIDEPAAVIDLSGLETADVQNEPEPVASVVATPVPPVGCAVGLSSGLVELSPVQTPDRKDEPGPALVSTPPTVATVDAIGPVAAEPASGGRAAGIIRAPARGVDRMTKYLQSTLQEELLFQSQMSALLKRVSRMSANTKRDRSEARAAAISAPPGGKPRRARIAACLP